VFPGESETVRDALLMPTLVVHPHHRETSSEDVLELVEVGESGSRDDDWTVDGQNDVIKDKWAAIVAADSAPASANASGDLTNLVNEILGAVGTALGIVAIVVA
jgi:hypothetical protein